MWFACTISECRPAFETPQRKHQFSKYHLHTLERKHMYSENNQQERCRVSFVVWMVTYSNDKDNPFACFDANNKQAGPTMSKVSLSMWLLIVLTLCLHRIHCDSFEFHSFLVALQQPYNQWELPRRSLNVFLSLIASKSFLKLLSCWNVNQEWQNSDFAFRNKTLKQR